ncbi:MAG: tryptophan--tRNA ligase, partial [Limnochordia bacterium]
VERFRADYANQTLRYADLKYELGEAIVRALAPIRERTFDLLAKQAELMEILDAGAKQARKLAQATMEEVREAMGFKMPVA